MNFKELYFEDGTIVPKHVLHYLNSLKIEAYPKQYIGSYEKTIDDGGEILVNRYLVAFYRDGELLDCIHNDNKCIITIKKPVYETLTITSLSNKEVIEYRKYDREFKKNAYYQEVEFWEIKTFTGEDTLCLCLNVDSRKQIFIGCDKYYNIEIYLDSDSGLENKRSGKKFIITKDNQYTIREIVNGIINNIDESKIKDPKALELFKLMICDPRVGQMIGLLMNKISKYDDDLYIKEEKERIQKRYEEELQRLEMEKETINSIRESSNDYNYGLIPFDEIVESRRK